MLSEHQRLRRGRKKGGRERERGGRERERRGKELSNFKALSTDPE